MSDIHESGMERLNRLADSLEERAGQLTTDLLRFDAFIAGAGIDARDLAIGGFLPAVQIKADNYYVTFFFTDDGTFDGINVMEARP